jgi:hypothetical protein
VQPTTEILPSPAKQIPPPSFPYPFPVVVEKLKLDALRDITELAPQLIWHAP